MKRVVFLEDLKESEIRPDSLYNKYKELLETEIPNFFVDRTQFVKTNCPGCGSKRFKKAFIKLTFHARGKIHAEHIGKTGHKYFVDICSEFGRFQFSLLTVHIFSCLDGIDNLSIG